MAAATHHPPSSGRLQSRSHTTDGEPVEPFLTSTGILRQAQDERVPVENGCLWRTGACGERVPVEEVTVQSSCTNVLHHHGGLGRKAAEDGHRYPRAQAGESINRSQRVTAEGANVPVKVKYRSGF